MSFQRSASVAAKKQAAWRRKRALEGLQQIPQVHGEGYTVYQGDALAIVPLLAGYDHCITDPPYEEAAHTAMRRARSQVEGRTPYLPVSFSPITEVQRRLFARLRCQWLLIFCQAEAIGRYEQLLGPKYLRPLFWIKRNGAPQFNGDHPAMGYESLVCAWCQGGRPHWNGGGKRGVYASLLTDDGPRVYDVPIPHGEDRVHPTQKPLPLMRELLQDFTQPGDLVLDPFMGSGTTGVACLALGRRFVGIECDPATFATACRRLAAAADTAARQGALFTPAPSKPVQPQLWATLPKAKRPHPQTQGVAIS